ncbi:MAG: hypothetical protein ACR2PH_05590 [Desulfobulbia bacterium]
MRVKELYSDRDWDKYLYICDYNPIVSDFGKVALKIDDDDYQGDSRVLYDNDDKIGYLIFGWGSCSGCDALQACRDVKEIQELYDSLKSEVKWFSTHKEALDYFNNKDWALEFSWHHEETKSFIDKSIEYLKSKTLT